MTTLTKDNDYIVDRGDHYSIATLTVNDSIVIDLDKRLHVENNSYISGDLQCEDIVFDGNIVVAGNTIAKNIQANEMYLMQNSNIKENVLGRVNIQFGRAYIGGSLISNGTILSISDLTVIGNASAATNLVLKGNAKFASNVMAGAFIDAHAGLIIKGNSKMAGVEFGKYGRYTNGKHIFIATESVFAVVENSGVADIYENLDDKVLEIKNGDFEPSLKEKATLDVYSWIKNIAADIRREE